MGLHPVLQCVAVCCDMLQSVADLEEAALTDLHPAMQFVAECCSVL